MIKNIVRFAPGRIIIVAFTFGILVGTLLLSLPAARHVPIPFLDLFFTSTSLLCVTGLFTIPLTSFTFFGKCVILLLMQLGGLGLITMTIFVLSLFMEFGFGTQILAGKLLELESWKNIKGLLSFIIFFALIVELIGAILFFLFLIPHFAWRTSLFVAVFHAVSSFCDAGLTWFPNSMMIFQKHPLFLLVTTALMFSGGMGFITWREIVYYIRSLRDKRKHHFSLHSKIVFSVAGIILVTGTLIYWFLERNNTLTMLSTPYALLNSFFNVASMRSTGFTTVIPTELNLATLLLIMLICFIGAAPGSTGSGIKTTCFAIFLAMIRAATQGRTSVELKGRRIPRDQVYKALSIISLSIGWILLATFILLITEKGGDFLDILFEVISAFATLGLSLGITPFLSQTGKIVIIITMIIGRIGSMTVILALRRQKEPHEYEYPEERVLLS
jgi:trk system potassium uptake protein TrkH